MKKRVLPLLLAMVMLFTVLAACGPTDDTPAPTTPPADTGGGDTDAPPPPPPPPPEPGDIRELPRNETLYFNGLNWGRPNGWNGFSSSMNNALAFNQENFGARVPMLESPYMFNILDGKLYPLLADGDPVWNADQTELTFKIKPAAKWSDGTPVTAHDVAFTWGLDGNVQAVAAGGFAGAIDDVIAVDDSTVLVKAALTDDGLPVNPLVVLTWLVQNHVMQKAWLEDLIARNGGDAEAMEMDPAEDIVFSGPYGPYFFDDTIVIMIRNDDYWGQDSSMWGKLPAPKYLAHNLFEDNAAGDVAFAAGQVDVSQNFIANVQNLWLEQGLPISTYFEDAPYGIALSMPTAFFNLENPKPGLEMVEVRRAIAIAVDYDLIIANAMTNQSPTFAQVPRSLMNPTPGEQALYDRAQVEHLQWVGNQVDEANELLDSIGLTKGDDGWRTINGERMSYTVSCPHGWTDWEAAMEIVAAAGESIGIELVTYFPEWDVYQTIVTVPGHPEKYDIFMMWTDSASPAQPWSRIRNLMTNEYLDWGVNWSGNWGGYSNDRVEELLALIPVTTSDAEVRAMYTELVEIYLTDIPSFSLMYRPALFHAVNESVWTGFTEATDGRNVPPMICLNGYAIADLYNLELVG
ncbi:MAG: ABC transporter substrate-binding protein [Oscillospiraceae bacterium]|nr:ABC transporter substrate-binding protein [Oscillospiraceae bacterium]